MPKHVSWTYKPDRAATIRAHAAAAVGGADSCDCGACRNFRLIRDDVFPPDFLILLNALGIDRRKDSEVVEYGGPGKSGLCFYQGWFHFVGELTCDGVSDVDADPSLVFWFDFTKTYRPRLLEFGDQEMQVLEFSCYAPWRLDEPYPGDVSPEDLSAAQASLQAPTAD